MMGANKSQNEAKTVAEERDEARERAEAAEAEAARWESIARTLALRHGLREELAALAAEVE